MSRDTYRKLCDEIYRQWWMLRWLERADALVNAIRTAAEEIEK